MGGASTIGVGTGARTSSGGAVKGGSFFWSISGLWPDALDELLAVLTAVEIGDMALVEAQGLLKHTGNEYVALIGSFKFKSL